MGKEKEERNEAADQMSRSAGIRPGSVRISRHTQLHRKLAASGVSSEVKPLGIFTAPMGMRVSSAAATSATGEHVAASHGIDNGSTLPGIDFTTPLRTLKVVQVLPGGLYGALKHDTPEGTKSGVFGATSVSLGHSSEVCCLRVSPSGSSLVSGDTYGRVVHWTMNKAAAVPHESEVSVSQMDEEIGELM